MSPEASADRTSPARRGATWSATLFAAIGVLLVLLGTVHLIALPFLRGWFVSVVGRASPTEPALILDHVISVPLLIALGVLTIHASRALRRGAAWARFACSTVACVVVTLPIATIAVVPADYLQGPAFAVAIVILGIATLLTIVAVVATWRTGTVSEAAAVERQTIVPAARRVQLDGQDESFVR